MSQPQPKPTTTAIPLIVEARMTRTVDAGRSGTDFFSVHLTRESPFAEPTEYPCGFVVCARVGEVSMAVDRPQNCRDLFMALHTAIQALETFFGEQYDYPIWRYGRVSQTDVEPGQEPKLLIELYRLQSPFYKREDHHFRFNHAGVCLNPDKIEVKNTNRQITVIIAQLPTGQWGAKHNYMDNIGGYSGGLCRSAFVNNFSAMCRQEAIDNVVREIKKRYGVTDPLCVQLDRYVSNNQQLTLF